MTQEVFIERARKVYGDKYDYSKYLYKEYNILYYYDIKYKRREE